MTDLDALHAAIVEDLDSDEPRLVLADALQAAGDPYGEFIALSCELTRLGAERTRLARGGGTSVWLSGWIADAFETGDPARRAQLRQRADHLLFDHAGDWFDGNPFGYRVERGFVEHVDADRHPRELFDRSPTIESMSLDLRTVGDETWFAEPRMLQLRQVRLSLGGLPGVGGAALHFLERVEGLRQLAYHHLDDAIDFVDAFPATVCATLEALGLDGLERRVPPEYLIGVAETAPHLRHVALTGPVAAPWTKLEALDIFELSHTHANVAQIPAHLPNLRALRLDEPYDTQPFDIGAAAIGQGLPALRVLELEGTPFTRYLQDLVGGTGLTSLTHLSLAGCSIDDDTLAHLIASPLGARLQHLRLVDNPLTARSLDALGTLTSLRRLYLSFPGHAVAELRTRLPNTEILT